MSKKWLRRIAAVALCAALAVSALDLFAFPAYAAGSTVYTFGSTEGPFRDLRKEHEAEMKRLEAERKKERRREIMREKAALKKAARERERKDKAVQNEAEQTAA